MASRSWLAQHHHLMGVLFLCSLGRTQKIEQPGTATALERRPLNLTCNLSSVTSEMVQWYQQVSGKTLEYLGGTFPKSDAEIANPKGKLYFPGDKTSSTLAIEEVTLADAAIYFCAPDNYFKFTLGSGTRLNVIPNLAESEPSVYKLEANKEPGELSACLITDYSPDPIGVKINKSDSEPVSTNGSAVVVKDDNTELASLGVVRWGKNDDQFHCSATYKSKTYEAEEEYTCSENEPSSTPVFETDERLNLLSLTVLGLRVIFFKSVALNLILTYCAWSRREMREKWGT